MNLACSGSSLVAGIIGSQTVNGVVIEAQLDQLYAQPKPYLVTVTIGANDMGWREIIIKCYTSSCGSVSDTSVFDSKLKDFSVSLNKMLYQIDIHYQHSAPKLVVTGYHQVLPATKQSCLELSGFDQNEIDWNREQLGKLNSTVRDVVSKYSYAKYVEVDFSGHELCTGTPWVQNISSLAPLHPNQDGQLIYAKAASE